MSEDLLTTISSAVASAKSIEQLTRPLLMLLELMTGFDSTYLTHVDQVAGVQNVLFSRNSKTIKIPEGFSVPWADTLCKRALDEGQIYIDDVAGCWGDSIVAKTLGIRTYVSMPVHLEDGTLFGTLCAASAESKPVSSDGRHALSLFATLIEQYIQREHLLSRLQQANALLEAYSFADALTGLPNRRAIVNQLQRLFAQARRSRHGVLVVFIDLDGFKEINDTYGHYVGDEFLIEIGRRLSGGLRAGDMLARLGGDEFVIVGLADSLDRCDPCRIDGAVRSRLLPLTYGTFTLNGQSFDYAGASFGVIVADPDSISPEDALQKADAAMYLDKKSRNK